MAQRLIHRSLVSSTLSLLLLLAEPIAKETLVSFIPSSSVRHIAFVSDFTHYSSLNMSVYKPKVSLSELPVDASTLTDAAFYELVQRLTSSDDACILRSQAISSTNTFLPCKDIPESILLPTTAFDDIRRNVCVKLDQNNNDSYVIHIGIHAQIQYLTELFRKNNLDETRSVRQRPSNSTASTLSSVAAVPTSTPISNSTTMSSSTPIVSSCAPSLGVAQHSSMVSSINKWVTGEGKRNRSGTAKLVEGTDFTIEMTPIAGSAVIICKCQTRLVLPKATNEIFSLSNLYKHWKTLKKCDVLSIALGCNSQPVSVTASSNSHNMYISELQLSGTIDKKIESSFRENLDSTFCSPFVLEYAVAISQLPLLRNPDYSVKNLRAHQRVSLL